MDRQMNGQTDEQTDEWADEQTDEQIDEWADEQTKTERDARVLSNEESAGSYKSVSGHQRQWDSMQLQYLHTWQHSAEYTEHNLYILCSHEIPLHVHSVGKDSVCGCKCTWQLWIM